MSFQTEQHVFPEWEGFFDAEEEDPGTAAADGEAQEDVPPRKRRVSYASLVEDYLRGEDISLDGLIRRVAGTAITQYWLETVFPPEVAAAHKSCSFHLHDLSSLELGKRNMVTVNLSQLGYLATDEDDFSKRLDSLLVLAKEGLDLRRQTAARLAAKLGTAVGDAAPVPDTLALCGLEECCRNLLAVPPISDQGKRFTSSLLGSLTQRLESYGAQGGIPFRFECETEREVGDRFALHDRQAYPDILTAGSADAPTYSHTARPSPHPASIRYELFGRPGCPSCPAVKSYMAATGLEGKQYNVDTKDGLDLAAEKGVFVTPTVILYTEQNKELARAHNVAELQALSQLWTQRR